MHWATILWSTIAATCLTVAAIHFLVWYQDRGDRASLFFSVTAVSTAGWTFCELWLMHSTTVGEQTVAIRLAQVPMFLLLVSITWFAWNYLRAGRAWLAWSIVVLRALYLLPNFLLGENPSYREMASPQRISFLGESVTLTGGAPNPFLMVGQFGVFLVAVFVADASVTAWRRGDQRKAVVVGGSIVFFLIFGLLQSVVVIWSGAQAPLSVSPFFVAFVMVMGYELSRGVIRASQLVTDLQVSEAELRESQARIELAIEAGDFGIWIWDIGRSEIWASEAWRALFGFPAATPLTFDAVLQRIHGDDRDMVRNTYATALSGVDQGRYQSEYRLAMPDGGTRWVASRGRVELDGSGRALVMRGAARDVTARKQIEQEMQLLRQDIAHAGRVSMMGQLASGLAHEINQPLAAILRNAEAAELFLQHPSPDLDEIRAILSDIRADDERAGHVIDRMRGLLKRETLDARHLDVRSLVDDVAALVRVDAAIRRVKLDVDVPADLPHVRGDRIHLQQVLLNLILNGMDALRETTVEEPRVRVTASLDGRSVEIAVADTGSGIPVDVLTRIFDPFFSTKAEGMGMGLAISRTIVVAHGGTLWAENQQGGGALFRFTLPLADAKMAS